MKILGAIHRLAETGTGKVKRLQGIDPPEYRMRVGDCRVRLAEEREALRIHSIKNRKDAYRYPAD